MATNNVATFVEQSNLIRVTWSKFVPTYKMLQSETVQKWKFKGEEHHIFEMHHFLPSKICLITLALWTLVSCCFSGPFSRSLGLTVFLPEESSEKTAAVGLGISCQDEYEFGQSLQPKPLATTIWKFAWIASKLFGNSLEGWMPYGVWTTEWQLCCRRLVSGEKYPNG